MNEDYLQERDANLRDYLADTANPLKIDLLATTKQNKLTQLTGYKNDKLLGMQDADTPITKNLGVVRESDPYGNRYDAVELKHGTVAYDMYGVDKKANPDAHGKSTYSMTMQREQTARMLGKPVNSVTEQDMLDVGNYQQIQKLADTARLPGEKRWEAPLLRNSTQVNLTGKYVDDKGKNVTIPLNVPINTRVTGKDAYGRSLGSVQNLAGEDVTHLAAIDSKQNAFAIGGGVGSKSTGTKLTKDYSTVQDRAINTIQGIGATLAKEVGIDTADFVGELFGIGDVGTEQEKQAMANKLVGGYDQKYSQEAMQKVQPEIDRLYNAATGKGEFAIKDLYEVVKAGFTTPELMGESLGYMGGLLLGTGKFTKGAKAVNAVRAEVNAGKITQAEGIAKVAELKKAEEAMSRTQRAVAAVKDPLGMVGKNAGLLTVAAGNVNDQIDEYKKNNNGVGPDVADVARMYGTEIAMNSLDRFTDVSILKNAGLMRGMKELVPAEGSGQALRFVGALAGKGATLAADVGKEAGQEFVQQFGQMLNEQWGTTDAQGNKRDFVDVLSDEANIKEGMTAAGMGMAGALQFNTVGATVNGLPKAVDTLGKYSARGLELATENELQKIARVKREAIDPLVNEATGVVLASGDTSKIEELVDKIHGNVQGLDTNAPKKYTYSMILSKALENAETAEEQDAVLDTMARLSADENSEFDVADVLGDIVQGTMEEFVRTINDEGFDAISNKLAENTSEGTMDIIEPARAKEVAKMLERLTTMKAKTMDKLSKIKGSDVFSEELDKSIETLQAYIGGKSVADVNAEVATLGYIEMDPLTGKVNVSKPGLATYKKKIVDSLYNSKAQNNLMDKKVEAAGGATLKNLAGFAKSRVNKLQPTEKREVVYQTENLADKMLAENTSIVDTIGSILDNVEQASGVTEENKAKYKDTLTSALEDVAKSNEYLGFVKDSLAKAEAWKIKGRLEFHNTKDGYKIVAKNDSEKTVVANYIDGKWERVARSKEDTISKPTVDEVVDAIQNRDKYSGTEAEQLIANASADGTLQQANSKLKEFAYQEYVKASTGENVSEYEEAKEGVKLASRVSVPKGKIGFEERFNRIVEDVARVDTEVARLMEIDKLGAADTLATYRKAVIAKWQADKSNIDKLIDRAKGVLETRSNRTLAGKILNKIMSSLQAIRDLIGRLVGKKQELQKEFEATLAAVDTAIEELAALEGEYIEDVQEVATGLGKAKVVGSSPYGKFAEVRGKRKAVEAKIGEKEDVAGRRTINEIAKGIVGKMKEEDSLASRLLAGMFDVVTSAKAKVFVKGKDSVFGSVGKDTTLFSLDNKEIINRLPKSFKDYFSASVEGKRTLNENIDTMREYISGLEIGEITEGKLGLSAEGTLHSVAKGASKKEILTALQMLATVSGKKATDKVTLNVLKLEPQLEEVVKFYTAKAMSDASKVAGDFLVRSKNDVMRDYGIVEDEEYEMLVRYAMDGKVSAASIRGAIAKDVMKATGLRVANGVAEITEEGILATLGTLVQAVAIDNGLFEEELVVFSPTRSRTMLKPLWENAGVERSKLTAAINKLQYMNESSARQLVGLVPIVDDKKLKLNSTDYIDERTMMSINKQQSVAYRISDKFEHYMDMDEEKALKILGYKDTSKMHVSEIVKQDAINDKLVREFNFLKDSYARLKGKEFYIPWGQTASDRITIVADLNFQESKLHRDFIEAVGDTRELDIGKDLDVFKVAVMQGLDMKPDKLGKKTVLGNFDELVKISEKGVEITQEGAIKRAVESLIAGDVDEEAMNEVFHSSEGFHGLSAVEALADLHKAIVDGENKFKPNLKIEIDAITSGMVLTLMQVGSNAAIDMMAKGGVYTEETKAKWEKYVAKWLGEGIEFTPGAVIEAGAVHAKELNGKLKEASNLKERLAIWDEMKTTMFMDIYATAGIGMVSEVEKTKAKLTNENANSDSVAMLNAIGDFTYSSIRSIAKSPVMVYIYGATLGSIKRKLGYSLGVATVVDTIKELADKLDAGEDTSEAQAFVDRFTTGRYVDKAGKEIDVSEMSEGDKARHLEIGKDNEEKILKIIANTFGSGLEKSFSENFGFVDTYRAAIKSVEMVTFEAYKMKLAKAVEDKLVEKYGDTVGKNRAQLSKQDVVEINEKLVADGYGHGIAWYEDGEAKHQSLNKSGDKGTDYSVAVTIGGKASSGQVRGSISEVNTGASATISIHAVDSRLIQDTLNRAYDGYTGGNVYDAIVLALDEELLVDTAKAYNTNTIETGFSRSILADNLTKLESMLARMSEEEIEELAKNLMVDESIGTAHSKEARRLKLDSASILENILEQVRVNNEERVENSGKTFYSGHSHIAGAGVTTVEGKGSRSKVVSSTSKLEELMGKVQTKERAKSIDGIIVDINKDVDSVPGVLGTKLQAILDMVKGCSK